MSQTTRTTARPISDLSPDLSPDVSSDLDELTASRTVVLDTSVLMADPQAHLSFGDADVVIPLTVIDELDRNKGRLDEAGRNARAVLRHLEELRVAAGGDIACAVSLPEAGTIRVEPNGLRLEELAAHHLDTEKADHRIVAAALGLVHDGRAGVELVSNDAALRIKAGVMGMRAAEHLLPFTKRGNRKPAGWSERNVSGDLVDSVYAGPVDLGSLSDYDTAALDGVGVNQFVVLRSGKQSALARRVGSTLRALPTGTRAKDAWGLKAKSKEQAFALDLLTDPDLPLVALEGAAGTGKSMLAIAAGLQQTFEREPRYSRMTILRPIMSVGNQDLGFLPGDLEDKLGPWFEAVVDTMVALSGTGQSHRECRAQLDAWVEEGRLTLEPVTFLRGRSLQSTYLLADEVQNYESSSAKTIVSRIGEGSKCVLIGDTTQIDSPWTSEVSNGLSAVIAAFTGEPEFGHVALTKGERSRIADLAADRM